jgi:uncharacterized repeat protein (TIGR03803 family)
MSTKVPLLVPIAAFTLAFGNLVIARPAGAANGEKAVYVFRGGDGSCPASSVIADAQGSLYGTTFGNGTQVCYSGLGTVFKLAPNANGTWTWTALYRFNGKDGANPFAGLIFDHSGNLYGTTWIGGNLGYGTVFRLTPSANGMWTETVLHSFQGYPDGANPYASLIFDAAGKNLYGTAWDGGEYGCGNVFRLTPGANGQWTETVLHSFNCFDGWIPYAGIVFDGEGNLYGATPSAGDFSYCGGNGCGSIFKLTPGTNGEWTYTALHFFHGKDGNGPVGTLLFEGGSLYGTTELGGDLNYCSGQGCGIVFKLSPGANGNWTETVLHYFDGTDGSAPDSKLIFDKAGNLYGTTPVGGQDNLGTVFKLAPNASGSWTTTILQEFNGTDGANPSGGLIFGATGSLYGTTAVGGNLNTCWNGSGNGCGLVFSITP